MFSSVGHLHPQHLGEGGERILICNRENGAQNKVTNNSIFVFFLPLHPVSTRSLPLTLCTNIFPSTRQTILACFLREYICSKVETSSNTQEKKISHTEKCSFFPNILCFYNVVYLKAGEKFEQCHCGSWN